MKEVPIHEKVMLTIEEAAKYSNIGEHKIRELVNDPKCDFALRSGVKKILIKRKRFENFLYSREVI